MIGSKVYGNVNCGVGKKVDLAKGWSKHTEGLKQTELKVKFLHSTIFFYIK